MHWLMLLALPLVGQSRPEMVFSLADLPAMRARTTQGVAVPAFASLLQRADGHLKVDADKLPDTGAVSGRWIQVVVWELAMAGYLTERDDYLEQAKTLLLATVRQRDVAFYDERNGHLGVGDAALGIALGYDWLYPRLNDAERGEVRAAMATLGGWLFAESAHSPFGADERRRKAHNHGAVAHGGMGLCALALGGHDDWLALATDRIGGYFEYAIDATGCGYEGVMYLGYGLHSAILFAEALRRSGGPDLVAAHPALAKIPDYVMWQTLPWGGGIVPINQTASLMLPATALWYLIQRNQDRVGLWGFLHQFQPDPAKPFLMLGSPQACTTLPFLFVWGDPELTPQSPAATDLSRFFARGQIAARDGWAADDTLVTMNVGETLPGIWSHGDQNSITFASHGEGWLVDVGPHLYTSDYHNVPQVGGVGQNWIQPSSAVQGTRLVGDERGDSAYIVGDASPAYKGVRFYQRRMLFVREPQPYLVVLDDLQLDRAEHEARIPFFTAVGHTISAEGQTAALTAQSGASCRAYAIANGPLNLATEQVAKARQPALAMTWRAVDPLLGTVWVALKPGEAAPRIDGTLAGRAAEFRLEFADGAVHTVTIGPDGAKVDRR